MRHIGTLDNETNARRFAAYLITQQISAKVDQEKEGWEIWVRDEDQLERAVEEFDRFSADPSDAYYDGVEQVADTMMRDEIRKREEAQKNVVEMRGKWKQPGTARRAPLVFILIALSVGATLWTSFGKNERFESLAFCSSRYIDSPNWNPRNFSDATTDIRRGEVWRILTPIFVHLDFLHLAFNMFWTYYLGSQIEDRRGTWRFLFMVLAMAILSNLAQALFTSPFFGGISGVAYGLFGYCWMKTLYDPGMGIRLSQFTIIIFIVFFFLGMTGRTGPIANTAHGVGLFVGVVIGYAPMLLKSLNRRSD